MSAQSGWLAGLVRGGAVLASVLGAFALGCSQPRALEGDVGHGEHALAATYKAGFGLRLNEAAARFAGLRIGEVETRRAGDRAVAAVPRDAVLHTVRGAFVYVENGGWLLRSPVRLGATGPDWTEIADGLYEGDRIATSGIGSLWLAEIAAVNGGVGCADGH